MRDLVIEFLGDTPAEGEYEPSLAAANEKLKRIEEIELVENRKGYLALLIAEEINNRRIAEQLNGLFSQFRR